MNSDIPPMPPAHILAKCDTILQDLVIQQRDLNKNFCRWMAYVESLSRLHSKAWQVALLCCPPPQAMAAP